MFPRLNPATGMFELPHWTDFLNPNAPYDPPDDPRYVKTMKGWGGPPLSRIRDIPDLSGLLTQGFPTQDFVAAKRQLSQLGLDVEGNWVGRNQSKQESAIDPNRFVPPVFDPATQSFKFQQQMAPMSVNVTGAPPLATPVSGMFPATQQPVNAPKNYGWRQPEPSVWDKLTERLKAVKPPASTNGSWYSPWMAGNSAVASQAWSALKNLGNTPAAVPPGYRGSWYDQSFMSRNPQAMQGTVPGAPSAMPPAVVPPTAAPVAARPVAPAAQPLALNPPAMTPLQQWINNIQQQDPSWKPPVTTPESWRNTARTLAVLGRLPGQNPMSRQAVPQAQYATLSGFSRAGSRPRSTPAMQREAMQRFGRFIKEQQDNGVVVDPATLVRMGLDPETARIISEASSIRMTNEGTVGRFLGPYDSIKRGGYVPVTMGDPLQRRASTFSRDPNFNPAMREYMLPNGDVTQRRWLDFDEIRRQQEREKWERAERAIASQASDLRRFVKRRSEAGTADMLGRVRNDPAMYETSEGPAAMRYVNPSSEITPNSANALANAMAAYNRIASIRSKRKKREALAMMPASAPQVPVGPGTADWMNWGPGTFGIPIIPGV